MSNYSGNCKYSLFRNSFILLFTIFLCLGSVQAQKELPENIKNSVDQLMKKFISAESDSDKVNILYDATFQVYKYDMKTGLYYANQSLELAEEVNYTSGILWAQYIIGLIYYENYDYIKALDSFLKIILADDVDKYHVLIGRSYNYIALIFSDLNKTEKTMFYYDKSEKFNEAYGNTQELYVVYNNLANIYYDQNSYELAIDYYQKSLKMNEDLDNLNDKVVITLNIGSCYIDMLKYDSAKVYLDRASIFMNKISDLDVKSMYYSNWGYYFYHTNQIKKAIEYFTTVLSLNEDDTKSIWVKFASEILAKIYISQDQYEKAYNAQSMYVESISNIQSEETEQKIYQLELQHEYEQKRKQEELEEKRKEIRYILTVSCLLFGIILLGLFYQRQKYRLKIQKTELKNSEYEKKSLSEEITYKNRELMNFALQFVQRNDFINEVKKKLKGLKSKLKNEEDVQLINNVELFVNQSISMDKARKEFQMNIELLHQAFFYKLNSQIPELTKTERQLALLSRLNYSSKKIAALLNITPHSVDVGRHRLRKKLGIDAKTDLTTFFNEI